MTITLIDWYCLEQSEIILLWIWSDLVVLFNKNCSSIKTTFIKNLRHGSCVCAEMCRWQQTQTILRALIFFLFRTNFSISYCFCRNMNNESINSVKTHCKSLLAIVSRLEHSNGEQSFDKAKILEELARY